MTLSSKERAALRGEAHHLVAAVHVGQHGLTETVRQTIDDTLRRRELVKIQFGKNASISAKVAATELARVVNAEVVQVIGRTATLYRENPDLEQKDGIPPWRRK